VSGEPPLATVRGPWSQVHSLGLFRPPDSLVQPRCPRPEPGSSPANSYPHCRAVARPAPGKCRPVDNPTSRPRLFKRPSLPRSRARARPVVDCCAPGLGHRVRLRPRSGRVGSVGPGARRTR
jgi:hypothetical protein